MIHCLEKSMSLSSGQSSFSLWDFLASCLPTRPGNFDCDRDERCGSFQSSPCFWLRRKGKTLNAGISNYPYKIQDARHLEFNMIGFNGFLLICEWQFVIFASHFFINEKIFLEIYKANKYHIGHFCSRKLGNFSYLYLLLPLLFLLAWSAIGLLSS